MKSNSLLYVYVPFNLVSNIVGQLIVLKLYNIGALVLLVLVLAALV